MHIERLCLLRGPFPAFKKTPLLCHINATKVGNTARMDILYALQRFDVHLFTKIFRQGERRRIRPLARALSRSADGYLYILVPLLLYILEVDKVGVFSGLLLASLLFERMLYWLLKNGLKRRRPQEFMPGFHSLVVAADRFSFPSGHTSAAFLLATALVIVYQGPMFSIYLWATTIGLSRIILGVHYPGDTLAGAIMGSTVVLLMASQLGIP